MTITMTNGLIFHLYGPEKGLHHYILHLQHSEIETVMKIACWLSALSETCTDISLISYSRGWKFNFCVSQKLRGMRCSIWRWMRSVSVWRGSKSIWNRCGGQKYFMRELKVFCLLLRLCNSPLLYFVNSRLYVATAGSFPASSTANTLLFNVMMQYRW